MATHGGIEGCMAVSRGAWRLRNGCDGHEALVPLVVAPHPTMAPSMPGSVKKIFTSRRSRVPARARMESKLQSVRFYRCNIINHNIRKQKICCVLQFERTAFRFNVFYTSGGHGVSIVEITPLIIDTISTLTMYGTGWSEMHQLNTNDVIGENLMKIGSLYRLLCYLKKMLTLSSNATNFNTDYESTNYSVSNYRTTTNRTIRSDVMFGVHPITIYSHPSTPGFTRIILYKPKATIEVEKEWKPIETYENLLISLIGVHLPRDWMTVCPRDSTTDRRSRRSSSSTPRVGGKGPSSSWVSTGRRATLQDGTRRMVYRNPAGEERVRRSRKGRPTGATGVASRGRRVTYVRFEEANGSRH